mmetsp:Transcript_55217/g.109651  ORF Transcript_55217/g.109651 Transcript_55217/m.109651 type:complete len:641 (-) Transcript_55217:752-2674(-)
MRARPCPRAHTRYLVCLDHDLDDHRFLNQSQRARVFLHDHSHTLNDRKASTHVQYELYREFIQIFFKSAVSWMLEIALGVLHEVTPLDIFLWAIMMGADELAYILWQRCDKPAHAALLGSVLCKQVAAQTLQVYAKLSMSERASRLEAWAVGILDFCCDDKMAAEIVSLHLVPGKQYHLLDLALHGEMKIFLAHRICIRQMSVEWRGGFFGSRYVVPEHTSYFLLILQTIFPYQLILHQRISKAARMDEDRHALVMMRLAMEASAMSVSVGREARRNAKPLEGDAEVERSITRKAAVVSASKDECKEMLGIMTKFSDTVAAIDGLTKKLTDNRLISRLLSFYSTPVVAFILRAFAHLLWVAVYVLVIMTTRTYRDFKKELMLGETRLLNALDCLWFTFHIGNFVDQRHMDMMQDKHHGICSNAFWRIWAVVDAAFVIGTITRILSVALDDEDLALPCWQIYKVSMALTALLVCVLTMMYFSEWRAFGELVIIVQYMMMDVFTWLLIFIILLFSFCICMLGLEKAGLYDSTVMVEDGSGNGAIEIDEFGLRGSFWSPFWAVFGEVDTSAVKSYSESLAPWIMWIYMLVAMTVLVNLLVAMFSSTFQRIQAQAEAEYVFLRYQRIFEKRHILTVVPPPFKCA